MDRRSIVDALMSAGQKVADTVTPFIPPELRPKVRSIGEALHAISPGTALQGYTEGMRTGNYGEAALNAVGLIPGEAIAAGAAKIGAPTLAMFAGIGAKTANKAKLAEAEAMAARGAYPDDIWTQTGWFKGVDGNWRFEIPDTLSHMKGTGTVSDIAAKRGETVGDVFYHPELYKAYPELGQVRVHGEPGSGASYGRYLLADNPTISVGNQARDPRSSMLHELQHGVQDIEGFAQGARAGGAIRDQSEALRLVGDVNKRYRPELDRLFAKGDMEGHAALDAARLREVDDIFALDKATVGGLGYHRSAGEVEARAVQSRANKSPEELRDIPPPFSEDVPRNLQIVRALMGK